MAAIKTKIRWYVFSEIVGWPLVAAVFLLAALFCCVFAEVPPAFFFLPFWVMFPFLLFVNWTRWSRRRRAAIVLGHVEEAVRLNFPVPQMIQAAAYSESGRTQQRLLTLYYRLEAGEELGLAVYGAVPELPATTARAIAAAESIGRLPQVMRRLVRRVLPSNPISAHDNSFYRGYAIILATFILAITALLLIVVMPKFNSIFRDFHVALPWATEFFIWISHTYLPLIALVILLIAGSMPTRGALRDYALWYLPVVSGAARDQAMAELCAFLSDAVEADQPMDKALAQAAEDQPNAVLRRKIRKWAALVAGGESTTDAARGAGMPSLLVGMLKTVRSQEDLVQVSAFLSRHYEYRLSRTREVLRAVGIPIFVAIVGSIVLLTELSIFQAMISLIGVVMTPVHHRGGF